MQQIKEKVIEILQSQMENHVDIDAGMSMDAIKINSIAFVKSIVQIEDELEVSFDLKMIDIDQYATVQDLIDYAASLQKNEADS